MFSSPKNALFQFQLQEMHNWLIQVPDWKEIFSFLSISFGSWQFFHNPLGFHLSTSNILFHVITTVFTIFISSQWCYESTFWRSKMFLGQHLRDIAAPLSWKWVLRTLLTFLPFYYWDFCILTLQLDHPYHSYLCFFINLSLWLNLLAVILLQLALLFWAACSIFLEWIS